MAASTLVVSFGLALFGLYRGPLRTLRSGERAALAFAGALLALAFLSLFACRMGRYSPWLVSLLLLAVGALASRYRPVDDGRVGDSEPSALFDGWLLGALLACFLALYALYPTYFLFGGQDPGLYLAFSAHIAKTGGLRLDQPWLQEIWDTYGPQITLGYPGVYSPTTRGAEAEGVTRLIPQFAHLFPAFTANFWSAAGLEGTVRSNAVLAVGSLWLGHALMRRLAGAIAALVFVVVLGINPAFVWGARITLTETLALALNLGGLLALLIARERTSTVWGIVGGAVLGAGTFNRVDAGVIGVAPLAFSFAAALGERELRRCAACCGAAYLAVSTAGHLDARYFSPYYFQDLVVMAKLGVLVLASTAWGVLAILMPAIPSRWLDKLRLPSGLVTFVGWEALRLVVLWALVALYVIPEVTTGESSHAAQELGWYVTPVAWPLSILGFGLAVRERAVAKWLPLLAVFAGSLILYTGATQIAPLHIWASRRWLPQVIPLMLVLGIYAGSQLLRWLRARPIPAAVLGLGLFFGYAVPALDYARLFLFQSMLRELPDAYARLVRDVRAEHPKLPLVAWHPNIASILTYVYDVPTVLIGPDRGRDALAHAAFEGRTGVGFTPFELGHPSSYSSMAQGTFLQITEGARPKQLITMYLCMDMGPFAGPTFEVDVPASDPSLVTDVGEPGPNGSLHTTGRAGLLQYGPSVTLSPGAYEVHWFGAVRSTGNPAEAGTLTVLSAAGSGKTLTSAPLRLKKSKEPESWLGGLPFALDKDEPHVEFRLRVQPDVDLTLTRLRFKRLAAGP